MATLPLFEQYRVQLPAFEGPLDLLLFFIKRDEIDIYDIPIAKITRDFLDYVNMMKALNIQLTGEFMVMAATLMRVKAHMLLPMPEGDEEEIEDPRRELVRMLIEYKRFKEVASELGGLEERQSKMFPRRYDMEPFYGGPLPEDSLVDVTLYDLMSIIRQVLADIPEETVHTVEVLDVTIEKQMGVVMGFFGEKREYPFEKLLRTLEQKVVVIVTFMAILELMRKQEIKVRQKRFFGTITIRRR